MKGKLRWLPEELIYLSLIFKKTQGLQVTSHVNELEFELLTHFIVDPPMKTVTWSPFPYLYEVND